MHSEHNNMHDPMEAHTYLKNFSIIHRMGILFHIHGLKKHNISGHQMGYLAYISQHPGISQEQLSQFFHLNKGAVAKGIRSLSESGYILRKPSQKDKRAYELYPTEQAQRLVQEAQQITQSFADILVKGMSDEEEQTFRQLLERAASNVVEALPDGCHNFQPFAKADCTSHCCDTPDGDFHSDTIQNYKKKGD